MKDDNQIIKSDFINIDPNITNIQNVWDIMMQKCMNPRNRTIRYATNIQIGKSGWEHMNLFVSK